MRDRIAIRTASAKRLSKGRHISGNAEMPVFLIEELLKKTRSPHFDGWVKDPRGVRLSELDDVTSPERTIAPRQETERQVSMSRRVH